MIMNLKILSKINLFVVYKRFLNKINMSISIKKKIILLKINIRSLIEKKGVKI
jgi:hypothetical protein